MHYNITISSIIIMQVTYKIIADFRARQCLRRDQSSGLWVKRLPCIKKWGAWAGSVPSSQKAKGSDWYEFYKRRLSTTALQIFLFKLKLKIGSLGSMIIHYDIICLFKNVKKSSYYQILSILNQVLLWFRTICYGTTAVWEPPQFKASNVNIIEQWVN